MKSFLFLFTILSAPRIRASEQEHCPICFENISSPELMPCGKALCSECLMKTLDTTPKHIELRCPFCRDPITVEFLEDLAERRGVQTYLHVQKALRSFSEKMLEKGEFEDALRFCDRLADKNNRSQIQAFALASLGRLDDAVDKLIGIQRPWKYFEEYKAPALTLEVLERWLEYPDKIHDEATLRGQQIKMLLKLRRCERVLEDIQNKNSPDVNILRAAMLGGLNRVSEALDEIERAASQEDFMSDIIPLGPDMTTRVFNVCKNTLMAIQHARDAISLEPEIMAMQRFTENEMLRSWFLKNIYRHQTKERFFLRDFKRERLLELMENGKQAEAKQVANSLVRDDTKVTIVAEACAIADIFAKDGDFVKAIQILDVVMLLGVDVEKLQMQKERFQNKD